LLKDGLTIHGVVFGELVGKYAKVHLFLNEIDGCETAITSLGRYVLTNIMSEEQLYHLDYYSPNTGQQINFR
jgi:hypothetical protein